MLKGLVLRMRSVRWLSVPSLRIVAVVENRNLKNVDKIFLLFINMIRDIMSIYESMDLGEVREHRIMEHGNFLRH